MDTPSNPAPALPRPNLTERLKTLLLGGAVAVMATQTAPAAVVPKNENRTLEARIEQARQTLRAADQGEVMQPGQGTDAEIHPTWWRNRWGNGGWRNWHNGWFNGGWHNWHNGWGNGGWHNWLNF